MARELWGLLSTDGEDLDYPLTQAGTSYCTRKMDMMKRRVRKWRHVLVEHPTRKDHMVMKCLRREDDPGTFGYGRFDKSIEFLRYSQAEYDAHITDRDEWTKAETDYLMQLAVKYSRRFVVMADRYLMDQTDNQNFEKRSVDDLKARFYYVQETFNKVRNIDQEDECMFDASNEERRREQLARLLSRSQKDIEEEQQLENEMSKIEARKREREKKTQDLQKLMTQASVSNVSVPNTPHTPLSASPSKRKSLPATPVATSLNVDGIKFHDWSNHIGPSVRSQRMKLPSILSVKKHRAIDCALRNMKADTPTATEENVELFNELRSDIVRLYEEALQMFNLQYEMHSMRISIQQSNSSYELPEDLKGALSVPAIPILNGVDLSSGTNPTPSVGVENFTKCRILNLFLFQRKKRAAAIEQGNVLRKIKQKV